MWGAESSGKILSQTDYNIKVNIKTGMLFCWVDKLRTGSSSELLETGQKTCLKGT
jgi:hypothetical protein